jgi:hypothetical protein
MAAMQQQHDGPVAATARAREEGNAAFGADALQHAGDNTDALFCARCAAAAARRTLRAARIGPRRRMYRLRRSSWRRKMAASRRTCVAALS